MRFTGLEDFQRRTESQTKMQHIRLMKEIKETQKKVTEASMRNLKRDRPLAEENTEMKKSKRVETRVRAAQEARNAPNTGPPMQLQGS
jgi:type II secretory pathway component HofQ